MTQVWEAIRSKRAVRRFADAPLPEDILTRILDAGRRAQSYRNGQPWDFIVIRDHERRAKLSTTARGMGHTAGAAAVVAIVTPAEADTMFNWHMFDIGQCAAYMQLAAQAAGVASCIGAVSDVAQAREILGFPPDKTLWVVISFGYPTADTRPGSGSGGRRSLADVVHQETW